MNPAKMAFNPEKHTVFTPLNKDKYRGEIPIVCKSSWEVNYCRWCDINPNIIQWSSESLAIPYYDEVKKKNRRYYPDFAMLIRDKEGKEKVYIVEIKPYNQVVAPVRGNKKEKTFLHEATTYLNNVAKWKAAEKFCKQHGYNFKVLTERDLYR